MKGLLWRLLLSLRYRIHYQGVENVPRQDAFLMLGNWTSQLDPLITVLPLKMPVVPLIWDNGLKTPWLRQLMLKFKAYFLPVYTDRGRSFYIKRLLLGLKKAPLKGNLLAYPQGKMSPLLQEIFAAEQKKVIFVQIKGMGGSEFSAVPMNWKSYLVLLLKNAIFFIPKREVTVTFSEVALDFPFGESLENMNRYVLERLSKMRDRDVHRTSYYFWKSQEATIDKRQEVSEIIYKEIERLSLHPAAKIQPEMNLYEDLSLDSLDVTEIIVFLEHQFQKQGRFADLHTVDDVIATALGNKIVRAPTDKTSNKTWKETSKRPPILYPSGKTIPELFLQSCERLGKTLACVDPIETLSYTRLKTLAVGLVEYCRKLPGKHIGILLPSTNDFNVVTLALMMAKKIPAPLNWTLGPAHLQDAVAMADIKAVFSIAPILDALPFDLSDEIAEKIILLEELRNKLSVQERQAALQLARGDAVSILRDLNLIDMKPEDTAVLLFTSGTEKKPKGVPLSHHNLISTHKAALKGLDFAPADVLLGILPPFHVFGFSLTHLFPLLMGCRALFHPNILDLPGVVAQIAKWDASVICTAPTFLRAVLSIAAPEQLRSVRHFIVGAEKTPEALIEQVQAPSQLIEGYGLTECSPLLTMNRLNAPHEGVGYPVEGVELAIVDPTTYAALSQGETGLILARGPNIFNGYLNGDRPFIQFNGKEWFITGDTGYLKPSGALHLSARLSRTVKIGGEMISLPAIENALQQQLKNAQVAVLAKEDEEGAVHLVLYCTQQLAIEEANKILREAGFSNLLRIKEIHILPNLPLTATGKIDYRALSAR